MKIYIKGTFKRTIFESDKGYVIGLLKVEETNIDNSEDYINKTVTFTGFFHELKEDDHYIMYGEEVFNQKYGYQFQVLEYERLKPTGKEGIIEFLSSDLFPGIGENIAGSIVETLGDNAIDKILEEPDSLTLVPKLTTKKANLITKILESYEESHATIVKLTELGFSMKNSLEIYNIYKKETIEIVDTKIYQILDKIENIGFKTIDTIALNLGYSLDDPGRVTSGIFYYMKDLAFQTGDSYFELSSLITKINSLFSEEFSSDELENYFSRLELETKIIRVDDKVYLTEFYEAEEFISLRVDTLCKNTDKEYKNLEKEIKKLENSYDIEYNDKQKEAIISSLQNSVTIITGGPGTGKTTIIKAIVSLYQSLNNINPDDLEKHLSLLAPTGRASKRMSESTLRPASTIHRFLKWNKEANEFNVNEFNLADSKFVIVDEVSMIDLPLMSNLLKGLTSSIQIVFVGDVNQLPSVGVGQVLKDLIDSKRIETIELDLLYRQSESSYISVLAQEIKNGELSHEYLEKHSDVTFLPCSGDSINNNLKQLCYQLKEKDYDESRIQIMAPMYRGLNGIDNLNNMSQEVFNPEDKSKLEVKYGDVIYREGDKILQLVNMPDENVFNGDIGIIDYIIPSSRSKSKKNEIYVNYDGNIVKYTSKDINKIKHGFVITIHKSQGSEFECVILPLSRSYYRMLYRKLIYTAVTRAKSKLILLGDPTAFDLAVQNNQEYKRKSTLMEKLQKLE